MIEDVNNISKFIKKIYIRSHILNFPDNLTDSLS